MNNHITIRLEKYNSVYSWFIRLSDKNNFDFSLINWLDFEYIKYIRKYPSIGIHIQTTFDNINYLYPLIVNKPYKIEPENNLYHSLNSIDSKNDFDELEYLGDLEDLEDLGDLEDSINLDHCLLPSKKLKRANAVITLDVFDIVELDSTLKYIFSNFSN